MRTRNFKGCYDLFQGDCKDFFFEYQDWDDPYISLKETFQNFFDELKPYEEVFGRDLLFFTDEMILSVLTNLYYNKDQPSIYIGLIETYFTFYNRAVPNIDIERLNKATLRKRIILDENELLLIMSKLMSPDSEETLDVMRKSCLILLYYGVDKNNIPQFKKEQVSDEERKLLFEDGSVFKSNIPDFFMDTLRRCKHMEYAVSTNQQYTEHNSKIRPLQQTDYLIRSDSMLSQSEMIATAFVDKIFSRNDFRSVGKSLSSNRVIESGFYRWVERKEMTAFTLNEFGKLYEQYFGKLTSRHRIYYDNYQIWKTLI